MSRPHRNRAFGPFPGRGVLPVVVVCLALLIFIGTAIWFAVVAPDEVPSHFDAAGRPDDWSSKAETLGWLVPLGVGIPLVLSIRGIWTRLPLSLINIPHKEHWIERGEREYLFDRLMVFMRTVAAAMALLFTAILLISMTAARTGSDAVVLAPTVGFLVVTAAALWVLVRSLDPHR